LLHLEEEKALVMLPEIQVDLEEDLMHQVTLEDTHHLKVMTEDHQLQEAVVEQTKTDNLDLEEPE
jgi:hypothetical protein